MYWTSLHWELISQWHHVPTTVIFGKSFILNCSVRLLKSLHMLPLYHFSMIQVKNKLSVIEPYQGVRLVSLLLTTSYWKCHKSNNTFIQNSWPRSKFRTIYTHIITVTNVNLRPFQLYEITKRKLPRRYFDVFLGKIIIWNYKKKITKKMFWCFSW